MLHSEIRFYFILAQSILLYTTKSLGLQNVVSRKT